MPEYALIVAGGKGTRMGAAVPKQFIEVGGKPVILHTLEAFLKYSSEIKIVLVLPAVELAAWDTIRNNFKFQAPIITVAGGATRFQSVRSGLRSIDGDGLVAIHDGVRPLVSRDIIAESFRRAAIHGCAVASVELKESIRATEGERTRAVERAQFRLIQTPQTFELKRIKEAYEMTEDPALTDDASVAERGGMTIHLFEGSYRNIKITTAEDLVVAGAMLNERS